MAYPTLIKCAGCGGLATIEQRCESIEVMVKKLGQLEEVTKTELHGSWLYQCPFCGYEAFGQPENSAWVSKEESN